MKGKSVKINELIIKNIKMRRQQLGLTQTKLAKKSKVALSTIGQLEMGLKVPTIGTLVALAKPLKLELWQIVCPNLYAIKSNGKSTGAK